MRGRSSDYEFKCPRCLDYFDVRGAYPAFSAQIERKKRLWLVFVLCPDCLGRLLGRAGVKDAFIRSGFEIPDHVPETLVIYRGGYGVSQRVLARGFSWSTAKPTACWFSTRYADIAGPRKYRHHYKKSIDPELGPLVVEAKIHRDEIVCWDPGDREENEVLLFGAKGSKISGDVDEWNLLAEEQTARIRLMNSGLVQSASDAA